MNIEHHVINLEISKKFKEIGVKQKSCFYWNEEFFLGVKGWELIDRYVSGSSSCCSAFLTSELLMILPDKLQYLCNEGRTFFRLVIEKNEDDKYTVAYVGLEFSQRSFLVKRNGELITALPNLILWLHENNFIKIDEINARI